MKELIYYVNERDEATGEVDEKLAAHTATTKLHAAFSSYIFNTKGQLLVTKRAGTKKVWPGVWTNTCCGHPMPGETREDAVRRRLKDELNLHVASLMLAVDKDVYQTPPFHGIVDHEYCPIFIGLTNEQPTPNPDEVSEYAWMDWNDYMLTLQQDPNDYSWYATKKPEPRPADTPAWSWWCKDQLSYLEENDVLREFLERLKS